MAMSNRLYFRVGMLVLVGLALSVGFLVFLAGGRGIQPTDLLETYSSESVQGLDVGATVRYRGVPIGRVTQIRLVSSEYRRPEGAPFNEGFQQVLVRFGLDPRQIGDAPTLEDAVKMGLRAKITAQGITGVNYVELDFVSPARFPAAQVPWQPRYPVVPSIPSTVAQVTSAAELLVQRLAAVPLEQMANDLSGLLRNINTQTSDGDLAITLRETAQTMALVRQAVERADVAGALAEFRGAATDARALIAGPEIRRTLASATAAAAELQRTAQRLPGAIDGMERTLRSARETTVDVQSELLPILIDLRATTANLRQTAEQLRTSPSNFLFGQPPAPERRR